MMYYVNKIAQPTGEHEVHTEKCPHLPNIANRQYLGDFNNCRSAVNAAKKLYNKVDGCYYCCRSCNNG